MCLVFFFSTNFERMEVKRAGVERNVVKRCAIIKSRSLFFLISLSEHLRDLFHRKCSSRSADDESTKKKVAAQVKVTRFLFTS